MPALTRDGFFDFGVGSAVSVEIGEPINATVKVLPMSGEGAAKIQHTIQEQGEAAAFAVAIAYCCASDDGKRMFTEKDIPLIGKRPWPYIQALGEAVMVNCGLQTSVEDAEGN